MPARDRRTERKPMPNSIVWSSAFFISVNNLSSGCLCLKACFADRTDMPVVGAAATAKDAQVRE